MGGSWAPAGADARFVHSLPTYPRTHRITITNFCLGKHLVSEGDLLKDQRGSPAYISPDVLSGRCGGPSAVHLLGGACPGQAWPGYGAAGLVQTSAVPLCAESGVFWGTEVLLTPVWAGPL